MAMRLCFTKYRTNFFNIIQSRDLGDDILWQISLQAYCKSGRSILKTLHLADNDLNLKASSLLNSSSPSLCSTALPTTSDPLPLTRPIPLMIMSTWRSDPSHTNDQIIGLKRDPVGLPLQNLVEDRHCSQIVGPWSGDPANFGDILLLKLPHQPSQLVLSAARGEVICVHHEQKAHGEVDPRRNLVDSSIRSYSCSQHLAASLVPYSALRKRPLHPGCSISAGSSTFLSLRITGSCKYALVMSTNKSFRGSPLWTRRVATSDLSALMASKGDIAVKSPTRVLPPF